MKSNAITVEEYLNGVPEERKASFTKLRDTILSALPEGFTEELSYGMIGYVVPHSIYPDGYHCNSQLPLPFCNIASQKNFIALYHMGIYANLDLFNWFTTEYSKFTTKKLDMGKSCIRFKKTDTIPYTLISELIQKISVQEWIKLYESQFKK